MKPKCTNYIRKMGLDWTEPVQIFDVSHLQLHTLFYPAVHLTIRVWLLQVSTLVSWHRWWQKRDAQVKMGDFQLRICQLSRFRLSLVQFGYTIFGFGRGTVRLYVPFWTPNWGEKIILSKVPNGATILSHITYLSTNVALRERPPSMNSSALCQHYISHNVLYIHKIVA